MANFNLNKTTLGGRIATDLELKQTTGGVFVCPFTVAVSRRANREKTDFVNCIAWRQNAEFISKHFRKGASICLVGNIQTRSWTDKNNQKRYATEVIVDEVYFVDSKNATENVDGANSTFSAPQSGYNVTEGFEEISPDEELPF